MKRYAEKIINMVKSENLFAPQGGPIILAQVCYTELRNWSRSRSLSFIYFCFELVLVLLVQIENEYNAVQLSYKENGKKYVDWAADMATSLYNGVPWVMCKQKEAPPSIVSAQS